MLFVRLFVCVCACMHTYPACDGLGARGGRLRRTRAKNLWRHDQARQLLRLVYLSPSLTGWTKRFSSGR